MENKYCPELLIYIGLSLPLPDLPKFIIQKDTYIPMHVHASMQNIEKANALSKYLSFILIVFRYLLDMPQVW